MKRWSGPCAPGQTRRVALDAPTALLYSLYHVGYDMGASEMVFLFEETGPSLERNTTTAIGDRTK